MVSIEAPRKSGYRKEQATDSENPVLHERTKSSMLGNMKGSSVRRLKFSLALLSSATWRCSAQTSPPAKQNASSHLIERVAFDWNHSGKKSTFSLFRQEDAKDQTSDRLVIDSYGVKGWAIRSHDGEWATTADGNSSRLERQNLSSTARHFLFVSSDSAKAHIYLILKGVDSGCCDGSLTVLTPNDQGRPTIVFQSSSHRLTAIDPTGDDDELALIGQPSGSEARAMNAQSYDPYRVYLLDRDQPARYDLARSKAYTIAHYCQWHGPIYDEKFVAVGSTIGASHCRVMSDADFNAYRQIHPSLFPEQ